MNRHSIGSFFQICLLGFGWCARALYADLSAYSDTVTVQSQEVFATAQVRVAAVSTHQTVVLNPMVSSRPTWVIPEGSVVTQGQDLVVFDDEHVLRGLTNLHMELELQKSEWARTRSNVALELMGRSNQLQQIRDIKATVEAELEGLKSRP